MFGSLIRRRARLGAPAISEAALESTLFSLTTDVPRPTENRLDERLVALLPIVKLVSDDWQDLCRIRNISAGGLMAETTRQHKSGDTVIVELQNGQKIGGTLVWTRETAVGVKFDQSVDLREILANRRPRIGFRPRPARLEIRCGATIQIEGLYHKVEVRDISLGGIKVHLHERECVGKDALVTVESLRPIKSKVRWHRDGMAGIVFSKPLTFDELAEWLGKRIEVASLRASTQPISRS
jgi:hypothetical protein